MALQQICAILLTLYLLDSRPLAEALAIFFAQRSRIFGTVVSKPVDAATLAKPRPGLSRQGSVKKPYAEHKDIRQSVEACLDIITRTIDAARTIFQEHESTGKSLMRSVLENMQPNSDPAVFNSLPQKLRLSTHLLLSSLPSSSHFLLLPQAIRSYQPYVDLTSTSSMVPPSVLSNRLGDWFRKSCTEFSRALQTWFLKVTGMKEMWKLRSWIRRWLFEASGLLEDEKSHLHHIVDDACRQQLTSIWTDALRNARSGFEKELKAVVGVVLRRPGASSLSISSGLLVIIFG
jgi:conserved oligomeric Golgi complex subunit 1